MHHRLHATLLLLMIVGGMLLAQAAPPQVQAQHEPGAAMECPEGVTCTFIPAYYGSNDPANPYNYGNYNFANRPQDGIAIRYVVIHNTEEPYNRTLEIFRDPAKYVSVHYVINTDGSIVQMVPTRDIAWHGGNDYVYSHAIGIEHVGYAIEGATWYTNEMYQASARLVRHLASQYHIPLDRGHIIGHDEIPGRLPQHQALMHWDPGPFWDWGRYMALLSAPINRANPPAASQLVAINPNFATHRPPLTYCYPASGCRAVPAQGANFVYLHTQPDHNAPLISNPYLGGAPTDASNLSNKAMAGQQFYRVERQGDWDALFFGGQKAWFYNPNQMYTAPITGTLITPAAGRPSIPVYGYPYPEPEAYPPGSEHLPAYGYRYGSGFVHTPAAPIVPIYEIPAGQFYSAIDQMPGQFVSVPYAASRDTAAALIVNGQIGYYQIFFNHRFGYVRASDVAVQLYSP